MQKKIHGFTFDKLDKPIVEYIWRNGNRKKTGALNRLVKGGVYVAGIRPENSKKVIIGFVLCAKVDEYDVIRTGSGRTKRPGFGKEVATKRAIKWENCDKIWIGKAIVPVDKDRIVIPSSIFKELGIFVTRCKAYYKDKIFPVWAKELIFLNEKDNEHLGKKINIFS